MSSSNAKTARIAPQPDGIDRWLLGAVDAGLAAVVLVAPFFMGGRQALGQLVLVALACFVALAWTLRQSVRRSSAWTHSPLEWILLAALALVALQIVPLPSAVLHFLSPNLAELLPLWTSEPGSPSAWSQLSLSPAQTRDGLVLLLAYALLALVATQRIEHLRDVERLLRWIALGAAAMATFGLVQYLASNGKFFWFYEHPFISTDSSVRGAFTNRNHFAHFLGLGLGPLLWWAQKGTLAGRTSRNRGWSASHGDNCAAMRSALGWLLLAMTLFALLMSFSRGGALTMLVALGVYVAVALHGGMVGTRFALALGGVVLLVGASLVVHGYRSVAARLDDLTSASLDQLDAGHGRRKIWSATISGFADFPLFGAGVGTHRELYPRYFAEYSATEYTHAENGYLQIAEETGIVGVALLLTGIILLGAWCRRGMIARPPRRRLAAMAAIAASLAASAAHSCVDFVWYVPSCVTVVALLAPCAFHLARWCGPKSLVESSPIIPRPLWLAGSVATALLAWSCLDRLTGVVAAEQHWDHYLIAHRGLTDPKQVAELMLHDFRAVVGHDPCDARGHLAAAEAHLRHFDLVQQQSDNPMSLTALRDAAASSPFGSADQLHAWLLRATGPGKTHLDHALWHTERALQLCPLLGQGYVYLAELTFLKPDRGLTPRACVDQALAVRPHDGAVLFKAGEESLLARDIPAALAYWKGAFHAGPTIQAQLIDYGAARGFPLAFFTKHFEPDLPAFRHLYARYGPLAPEADVQQFRREFAAACQQAAQNAHGPAAAALWLEMHRLSMELGDLPVADHAIERALACDPNHFEAHRMLGLWRLEQQRYDQAEEHLRWCQRRLPGDALLREQAEQATRRRIDTQTQSASAGGDLPAGGQRY